MRDGKEVGVGGWEEGNVKWPPRGNSISFNYDGQ